jgi:hypothetical protein
MRLDEQSLWERYAMSENIQRRWEEARAARLKEEFLDAFRHTNSFTEEESEHFFKTLDYAFRYWMKNHGPVRECAKEFRKSAVRELKSQAKQHYTDDIGRSYGLAVFSFHIEASFLPGEDASFVYDVTAQTISRTSDLVEKLAKP